MNIEVTGGTVQVRDGTNVRTRNKLREMSADLMMVLRKKYPEGIEDFATAKPWEIKNDGEMFRVLDDFGRHSLMLLVTGWSFEQPLPTTLEEWDDMEDPELYDEIIKEVTGVAYARIAPAIRKSPELLADPESPTELSSV